MHETRAGDPRIFDAWRAYRVVDGIRIVPLGHVPYLYIRLWYLGVNREFEALFADSMQYTRYLGYCAVPIIALDAFPSSCRWRVSNHTVVCYFQGQCFLPVLVYCAF